jgi:hypothetical protein
MTTPVWNAPLRALHSALLLVGGTEMAREFWGGHPLELNDRILEGADLHQYIWDEKALSPLEYQLRVVDSVEAFCQHHEIDFLPFLERYVFGLQGGTFLSPRGALSLIGRFLIELTRSRDVRRTILELFEPSNRLFSPKTIARLAKVTESDGVKTGWIVQIHDPLFRSSFPGYDAESWLGMQLRHSPNRMGVASFDDVDCLCQVRDTREILEAVPRGHHPARTAEGWSLGGKPLSRTGKFFEWLADKGLGPSDLHDVQDHQVEIALQDVFLSGSQTGGDPQRLGFGRPVLSDAGEMGWSGASRRRIGPGSTHPGCDGRRRTFRSGSGDRAPRAVAAAVQATIAVRVPPPGRDHLLQRRTSASRCSCQNSAQGAYVEHGDGSHDFRTPGISKRPGFAPRSGQPKPRKSDPHFVGSIGGAPRRDPDSQERTGGDSSWSHDL